MPPLLCKLGMRFDHTKGMFCAVLFGYGLKIGGNLSENLFFFCSSPNFVRKTGQILSEDFFFVLFILFALHLILCGKSG